MSKPFKLDVPLILDQSYHIELRPGEILFVLGANGTGKSSLVSRFFSNFSHDAVRISAHRQTWFESSILSMSAQERHTMESNTRAQDSQVASRHSEWNSSVRPTMSIFDLVKAEQARKINIADKVISGDLNTASEDAKRAGPIEVINDVMRLSNLPIMFRLHDNSGIIVKRSNGEDYNVAELSDGERSAFLLSANILTAKPGTLFLIDEPERHLHRSIISPMLSFLFERRQDCAFVICTHEPALPVDCPKSSSLLLRECKYQGQQAVAWDADLIPPGTAIDDDLKRSILGSRKKIIFVEGTTASLDAPLYTLLFPDVSIVPVGNCRQVENAVRGLREATDLHWVLPWGIIDRDQRNADDIEKLRIAGVWALTHYSIESFYYHPKIIARLAKLQAKTIGDNPDGLEALAINDAISAVKAHREHLVMSAVLRSVRNKIVMKIPNRKNDLPSGKLKIEVDVQHLFSDEEKHFDQLIVDGNWDGLLTRYPVRESPACNRVEASLKIVDGAVYRSMVLKLLQDDSTAVDDLRGLLDELYSHIGTPSPGMTRSEFTILRSIAIENPLPGALPQ